MLYPRRALSAVNTCLERGWSGFEWDWIDKSLPSKPINGTAKKETEPIDLAKFHAWQDDQQYVHGIKPEWRDPKSAPPNMLDDYRASLIAQNGTS